MMPKTTLKQLSIKLNDLDQKVSSLLVKQAIPTKTELKAIRESQEQIAKGHYITLEELKRKMK